MIRVCVLALVASLLSPSPIYSQQGDSPRGMTTDDALDIVGLSNAEISPDGEWILYSRSDLEWSDNERVSHLWMASADGVDNFQFTSEAGDSSAQWSPDGKAVAFLSSRRNGETAGGDDGADRDRAGRQIWLIRTRGGEAWKLSGNDGGVSAFEWAPDGKSIIFRASDAKSKEEKESAKGGDDAIYVDEGPNGQGQGSWSNLWAIDIAEKEERQITNREWSVSGFAVSPDGGKIAFHARTDRERNNGTGLRFTRSRLPEARSKG